VQLGYRFEHIKSKKTNTRKISDKQLLTIAVVLIKNQTSKIANENIADNG
jgi:hypothetical protein